MTRPVSSMGAPHFKTVPSILDLPGARERAAEGLCQHFSAKYGVPFRVLDDGQPISGAPVPTATEGRTDEGSKVRDAA